MLSAVDLFSPTAQNRIQFFATAVAVIMETEILVMVVRRKRRGISRVPLL
jgi:hypothetical protein